MRWLALPILVITFPVFGGIREGFLFDDLTQKQKQYVPVFRGTLKDDSGEFPYSERARKRNHIPEGPVSCGIYMDNLEKKPEIKLTGELTPYLFFPQDYTWEKAVQAVDVAQIIGKASEYHASLEKR